MSGDEALAWAHAHLPADPAGLVVTLGQAGWVMVGGRAGAYTRMVRTDRFDTRHMVVVPLDPTAPEYPEQMAGALAELKMLSEVGRQAQQVLDALATGVQR